MKKKIVSFLMLILILTNTLGLTSIMSQSLAKNIGNNFLNEDFMEKMNEKTLTDKAASSNPGESKGFNASRETADKWNFNETNEWKNFTYINGDKTRLIVGLDNENSESLLELEKIATKHQAEIVNTISIRGEVKAAVVELSFASVAAFAQDVKIMELASYVEPNMKVQTQWTPNDPYWTNQWGPQKIEVDWAWNTTTGSSAVLVAIVDTGIDYTHPDLATNYASLGHDWVNMDMDPKDDFGHGTHCAGIVAAMLNNSVGVAGLAQVRVMSEKVLDRGGYGYWDWIANGIIHATDSGADIISMSFGGYGDSESIRMAVKYAYDARVLVIAAAGNDNTNMKLYPAGYDEVVAVAATDQYDNKAYFSNWGDWIEIAAPGVDIYSTMPTYWVTMNNYGFSMNYAYMSGTSMACPHVSGLAALIWSLHPEKSRDWIRLWLRYTAEDLGEQGFDVYYGYGRINARKAVEQIPPEHELIAYTWQTPPYVEPETSGTINVTVLNFGESDETDITTQLIVNNTIVDFALIGFLASGDAATINLSWNPIVEGLYNVTLYVIPALGETSVENNVLSKFIYVGIPVKAVVLHSAGNVYGEIVTNWQVLSSEWYLFGNSMVYVDYTTLNKEGITYEDIAATEADVLIISCAYDPYAGWQFTDSEIDAITLYVHEGHGLIVTAGTLYYAVPNNNKLARLIGINETAIWTSTGTDLLHLLNTTHPFFKNVPNPFVFAYVGTAISSDGRWDSNELVEGKYLALGHFQESAIVTYKGLVYISPWLEIIPPYYHHNLQLLYNAILYSRYSKPEHELVVSLETPKYLQPGESALLNATVLNNGLNNETNVELYLAINGTVVNSTTISELIMGNSYTLDYLWTPTIEGIYNITAYSPPLPSEDFTINNVDSTMLYVGPVRFVLWDDTKDNDDDSLMGNYLNLYQLLTVSGFVIDELKTRPITSTILVNYDILVLPDPELEFSLSEITDIQAWIEEGGALIIIPDGGYPITLDTLMAPYGVQMTGGYGGYGVTTNIINHPITQGVGSIYVNWVREISVEPPSTNLVWTTELIAFLSTTDSGEVVVVSDSNIMDNDGLGMADNSQLMLNMFNWVGIKPEHDLAVSLNVSAFIELGDSTVLNATVKNKGINNEVDIELYLLVNDTIVHSATINELLVGESYFISHSWASTGIGSYNVTAYASPVPGETYITNNAATQWVHVFFYRRSYISHEWVGGGHPMSFHSDDWSWQYTLPFDFPFYGASFRQMYISSNGLITFLSLDIESANSIPALAEKLAIAPAWDDWATYSPFDVYAWETSTQVGIRWYVNAFGTDIVANFEVILSSDGTIQFNYENCNGTVTATVGISNGIGHVLAEDLTDLNFINSIVFVPTNVEHDVAILNVEPSANEVTVGNTINVSVTVENQGNSAEDFSVTAYAFFQGVFSTAAYSPTFTSTRIYLDPSNSIFNTSTVSIGYRFNVTVKVADVEDLMLWQIRMFYNGNIINATRWFEPTWDLEYVFYNKTTLVGEYLSNNSVMVGAILFPSPPGQEPFYGSGKLCIIEFEVVSVPPEGEVHSCSLNINNEDTFLWDSSCSDIPAVKENGHYELRSHLLPSVYVIGMLRVIGLTPGEKSTLTFTWNTTDATVGDYLIYAMASMVQYETDREDNTFYDGIVTVKSAETIVHDIAIVNVTIPFNVVYQGWVVSVNVTVANLGNGTETFSVTLYYSNTVIATENVQNLDPNATLTLSFNWNTTSVPYHHNYTIKAVASIVSGEANTENNIFAYGLVEIRMMGDVNGDGKVDMSDIGIVCFAFGASPDHPRWNPTCDLDQNGIIDLRDIGLTAKHFGEIR